MTILQLNMMGGCKLDLSGSGQGHLVESYMDGNMKLQFA